VAWLDGDVLGTAQAIEATKPLHLADSDTHVAEQVLMDGIVRRERNEHAWAVARLREAADLAAATAHDVVGALAADELARCHRAAGSTMNALELVMSTRASHPDLPYAVDLHLRSTEARLRLDRGDVAGAHAVVRASPPGVDSELLAARVALRHAPGRAAELLRAMRTGTRRQAVEKLLLRAQVVDAEPAEASGALIKAVSVGEPLGMVRTFLEEGPEVNRKLLDLGLGSHDPALGRLAALACEELAMASTLTGPPLIEQLTGRELAVLRLLPLRMSNHEIAAQLYVSINTVKTHIRAIYRKLGVTDRSAAVRRARALELV
jgi:LuxR family maltose regulon positive regulatory protein